MAEEAENLLMQKMAESFRTKVFSLQNEDNKLVKARRRSSN
mgnify:CR=1 FL=1